MDNLNKIKFKESIPGWLFKIDGSGRVEFKKGTRFTEELQAWLDLGNEIESRFTSDELAEKESKEKESAYNSFKSDRDGRIIEADKWEIPSIQKRFEVTQEQVEVYKQFLCDMPATLTIESTIEELQNPNFPPKLIEGLL